MRTAPLERIRAEFKLWEIAEIVDGKVEGDKDLRIRGACGLKEARVGDISYISHSKHIALLEKSNASAVVATKDLKWNKKPVIRVDKPSLAFLKVLSLWNSSEGFKRSGIHPRAVISETAVIGKNVTIGPGTVIEDDCVLGSESVVLANSFIGQGTQIGQNVIIYPNVTVREKTLIGNRVIIHSGASIGSDGYGYETVDGKHIKIPQLGNVELEDDVEIGSNSCVDRARFGTTLIKKGTKIDNLVQIAHNCTIGEGCLIVSLVGIAGSAELGDHVVLAGQVGVQGHSRVGSRSVIGSQSGVYTSVPDDSILLGTPPLPIRQEKERIIYSIKLPQLFKDVKELKKRLDGKASS